MAERSFITFYIGENLFGIDILYVREIIKNFEITTVHRAPEHTAGLLDVRGQIITIMNLKTRMAINIEKPPDSHNCIIIKSTFELEKNNLLSNEFISNTSEESTGLLVNRIGDVVSINSHDILSIEESDTTDSHDAKFNDGIVSLENAILVTLNLPKILSTKKEISATI